MKFLNNFFDGLEQREIDTDEYYIHKCAEAVSSFISVICTTIFLIVFMLGLTALISYSEESLFAPPPATDDVPASSSSSASAMMAFAVGGLHE